MIDGTLCQWYPYFASFPVHGRGSPCELAGFEALGTNSFQCAAQPRRETLQAQRNTDPFVGENHTAKGSI